MPTADFAVITCVSDPKLYDRSLLSSVYGSAGGHEIEVVPILNDRSQYSAAAALNIGIENSKAPVMIFAHQDVSLVGEDWFDGLAAVLGGLPSDWGCVTAAGIGLKYGSADIGPRGGALDRRTVAVGEVWDSIAALADPPYWDGDRSTQPVHCAEECLMVVRRGTGFRHDASYDGYHFYGVDLSLQMRAAEYGVWGAHLPIVHSGGSSRLADRKYWSYFRYLHGKWSGKYPEMYTTHCHWNSDGLMSYIPSALEDEYGRVTVKIRARGFGKVVLSHDHNWGIHHED